MRRARRVMLSAELRLGRLNCTRGDRSPSNRAVSAVAKGLRDHVRAHLHRARV